MQTRVVAPSCSVAESIAQATPSTLCKYLEKRHAQCSRAAHAVSANGCCRTRAFRNARHSTSLNASIIDAPTQEALSVLDVEADLHNKCLQAAVDLQEHGWAIVEGVLSQAECDQYVASLWDWLEGLGTGIQRSDPASWTPDRWPPTYRGILNTLEVAHQAFVWRVRKQKRVCKVFELMLGTNELMTSFDAINVLAPHNEAPAAGWLHVDQTPLRPHFACLQGLVNLVDVSAETSGTLMVKDKSHKMHQDFFHTVSQLSPEQLADVPDHYQFTPEQLPYWDQFDTVKLKGGAGSLFLWDSRTTHSNTYPEKIKTWRHVVYTCYQPRGMARARDLELKAQAWERYQITTHLPAENIRVYDENFAKLWPNEAKVLDTHQPDYKINRDRQTIEDKDVLRLAGVQEYPASEVTRRTPWVQTPVTQLQKALQQTHK